MDCYQKYQENRMQCGLIGSNYYMVLIRAVKILLELFQTQQFSLYHSQTIDFTGIFTDFKSVSNSGFFPLLIPAKIRLEERTK
ncbi:MAG: hypothetical protein P4L49_07620 [Desulfosporosinus sp.]|nr:hypothetical protein [Desulfosporosinus sp.]